MIIPDTEEAALTNCRDLIVRSESFLTCSVNHTLEIPKC